MDLPGLSLEVSFYLIFLLQSTMVPFNVFEAPPPPPRLRLHATCCPASSPAGPCSQCPWLPAGPSVLCDFGVHLFPGHVVLRLLSLSSISCVSFCLFPCSCSSGPCHSWPYLQAHPFLLPASCSARQPRGAHSSRICLPTGLWVVSPSSVCSHSVSLSV